MKLSRNKLRIHRKKRIRAKISGIKGSPRLCGFRSRKKIEVQIIDDATGKTLAFADSKIAKAKNIAVSNEKYVLFDTNLTCIE